MTLKTTAKPAKNGDNEDEEKSNHKVIMRDTSFKNVSGEHIAQVMYELNEKGERCRKGIRRVLEERGLWPNTDCFKMKCGKCRELGKEE